MSYNIRFSIYNIIELIESFTIFNCITSLFNFCKKLLALMRYGIKVLNIDLKENSSVKYNVFVFLTYCSE